MGFICTTHGEQGRFAGHCEPCETGPGIVVGSGTWTCMAQAGVRRCTLEREPSPSLRGYHGDCGFRDV